MMFGRSFFTQRQQPAHLVPRLGNYPSAMNFKCGVLAL